MKFKKDPSATLDYTVDWTAYLLPIVDTIINVDWIVPTSINIVSQSNTATAATVFVSGGNEGDQVSITCRITTAGGRVDDRSVILTIINR